MRTRANIDALLSRGKLNGQEAALIFLGNYFDIRKGHTGFLQESDIMSLIRNLPQDEVKIYISCLKGHILMEAFLNENHIQWLESLNLVQRLRSYLEQKMMLDQFLKELPLSKNEVTTNINDDVNWNEKLDKIIQMESQLTTLKIFRKNMWMKDVAVDDFHALRLKILTREWAFYNRLLISLQRDIICNHQILTVLELYSEAIHYPFTGEMGGTINNIISEIELFNYLNEKSGMPYLDSVPRIGFDALRPSKDSIARARNILKYWLNRVWDIQAINESLAALDFSKDSQENKGDKSEASLL